MTIITYTGSFKYIAAIFFVLGAKANIARTAEVATTSPLPLTLTAYPIPTPTPTPTPTPG